MHSSLSSWWGSRTRAGAVALQAQRRRQVDENGRGGRKSGSSDGSGRRPDENGSGASGGSPRAATNSGGGQRPDESGRENGSGSGRTTAAAAAGQQQQEQLQPGARTARGWAGQTDENGGTQTWLISFATGAFGRSVLRMYVKQPICSRLWFAPFRPGTNAHFDAALESCQPTGAPMAVGKSSAIERQAAYIIGIRNSEAYQKAKLLGSQIQKALLDKLAVHAIPCTDFTFEQWTEAINATVGAAAASPNSEVIVCVPAPRDTNHHHHPPNAPPPPQPAPNHHQHHPAPSAVSGSSGDRPAEVQAAVEAMTLGSGRVQLLSNRAQDLVHWAEEKFAAEIDFVEPSAEECASAAESETAQWMREK
ncbi:MAG: hypothetical protein BJ554DRAFT_2949, partial [Olpidium bornovanus]